MSSVAFDQWVQRARNVPLAAELARRQITLKGRGINRAGACPCCGGSDRFGVNLKKGLWHCRACGAGGDTIALVQHLDGVDFVAACATLAGPLPAMRDQARRSAQRRLIARRQRSMVRIWRGDPERYEREQHRKATWLWSQRQPIAGTPAEIYLRDARKISCPLPPTLGYLPPSPKYPQPTMIAAFGLADEIEPGVLVPPCHVSAVHLTKLRDDGRGKADVERAKTFLGSPGALPIVLAPANDLLAMAITEGIEDALSVHQATELGAWAAGTAGRLPALAAVMPRIVETITIVADADAAGRDHAQQLADALTALPDCQILTREIASW